MKVPSTKFSLFSSTWSKAQKVRRVKLSTSTYHCALSSLSSLSSVSSASSLSSLSSLSAFTLKKTSGGSSPSSSSSYSFSSFDSNYDCISYSTSTTSRTWKSPYLSQSPSQSQPLRFPSPRSQSLSYQFSSFQSLSISQRQRQMQFHTCSPISLAKVRRINVVLLEHLNRTGFEGQEVEVAPGYARNYLIPQRKAVYATEENRDKYIIQRPPELIDLMIALKPNLPCQNYIQSYL